MVKEFGKLYVAVRCANCGPHGEGEPLTGDKNRCGKCGQFAPSAPEYCVTHDLDYRGLYRHDNHCPYCREEQNINAQMMHDATRDPTIEPW